MKILYVLDQFGVGGVAAFTANYANAMIKHGHSVLVIGKRGRETHEDVVKLFKKVPIFPYHFDYTSNLSLYIKIFWNTFILLPKYIDEFKPDIVHLSTTPSAVAALLHTTFRGIPTVMTYYGAWDLEVESRINFFNRIYGPPSDPKKALQIAKTKVRHLLQQWCLNASHSIVSFSDYATQQVTRHMGMNPHKITIIPGALQSIKRPYSLDKSAKKKRLGITDKMPVILLVSRLDPRKNIHTALSMAAELVKKKFGFHLVIGVPAYEGDYFDYLIHYWQTLKENMSYDQILAMSTLVRFTIAANQKECRQLMEAADIFLMISTDLETFGMTTIEALDSGALVAGVPTGATPEILSQLPNGKMMLTKDGTAHSIADKVRQLSAMKNEGQFSHLKVREKLNRLYSPHNQFVRLLEVYQRLMREKRS